MGSDYAVQKETLFGAFSFGEASPPLATSFLPLRAIPLLVPPCSP